MKNYFYFHTAAKAAAGIAAVLYAIGACLVDSASIVPTIVLVLAAFPVGALAIGLERVALAYRRGAKRAEKKRQEKEKRDRIVYNGSYTKLSA